MAHADSVPLLGDLRTSAVIGAAPARGDNRVERRADRDLRSDDAPRRTTPSGRPGCLPPPRPPEDSRREGSLRPRRRPLAHAAHTFSPGWGKCFQSGIASSRCGHPHSRDLESADTFFTLWTAPGADDPSTPSGSADSAVDEVRLPRSHRRRPQCLDGFYDQELTARCAASFMSAICPNAPDIATKKIAAQSLFYPQDCPQRTPLRGSLKITSTRVFRRESARKNAARRAPCGEHSQRIGVVFEG